MGVDSGQVRSQTEIAETTQPGDNDVARSSFRRTGRYPYTVWRNLCVFGTEPFELADYVAFARQGREDVQTQRHGGRCFGALEAVCRPQAQGGGPDRPELSDHHDPGGGAGWVLAAPRPATGGDREPRGRSRFDRHAAAAHRLRRRIAAGFVANAGR